MDRDRAVLITAQGLLMYLPPPRVRELVAACAERFPGGSLVLDAVPRWFARLTRSGKMRTPGYQAPPMPWAMDARERDKLRTASPAITAVRDVRPTADHGPLASLLPLTLAVPPLSTHRPTVTVLDFAART